MSLLYYLLEVLIHNGCILIHASIALRNVIILNWGFEFSHNKHVRSEIIYAIKEINTTTNSSFFSSVAQQSPVGQDLLIIEASRSHADTPQSVGFLRKGNQPDIETSI